MSVLTDKDVENIRSDDMHILFAYRVHGDIIIKDVTNEDCDGEEVAYVPAYEVLNGIDKSRIVARDRDLDAWERGWNDALDSLSAVMEKVINERCEK